ncbi:jg5165 [Pararge aegeria aegeria]|uniref:Jg5165 protein n=1 Tax=Pararge aegeria aegeria TaxID=348720 RepID=A0A8S4S2J1_9NEOP|nr:jg5165 [Pararge aegeria aegeria]
MGPTFIVTKLPTMNERSYIETSLPSPDTYVGLIGQRAFDYSVGGHAAPMRFVGLQRLLTQISDNNFRLNVLSEAWQLTPPIP